MNPSSIQVRVEAFVGSSITDVTDELCALADRLGIDVRCDFNGIDLLVGPRDRPGLVRAYYQQCLQARRT